MIDFLSRITNEDFVKMAVLNFYEPIKEDRAKYFEGCLLNLAQMEKEPRFQGHSNRMRDLLIWCESEDLPELVAHLLYRYGCDIEDLLVELLEEQKALDAEAAEDYWEFQQTKREVQSGKA